MIIYTSANSLIFPSNIFWSFSIQAHCPHHPHPLLFCHLVKSSFISDVITLIIMQKGARPSLDSAPLWSTIRLCIFYNLTAPSKRVSPSPPEDVLKSSVGWAQVTTTNTQIYIYTAIKLSLYKKILHLYMYKNKKEDKWLKTYIYCIYIYLCIHTCNFILTL